MARPKVLLSASTTFILFSLASAQGPPFGFGGGGGGGNDNGNGDRPPWAQGNGWNNTFGCAWWGGSDCNGNGGSDSGGNSNNGNSAGSTLAAYGLTTSEYNKTNSIITAHAVLACLVWVFLIPSGGILLRSISSPWVVRAHALLQTLSYVVFIIAAGMGVWLVRQLSYSNFDLWSDPHPKLGVLILALAFLQPILGFVHHMTYKRRVAAAKSGQPTKAPGRTGFAYVHIWLGRFLIVAGMVAGGLGLRLAGHSPFANHQNAKVIAYSVGAAIMFILYLIFVILGERRRSKSITQQRQGVDYNEVPLEDRSVPPPAYNNPPTYQQAQGSGSKQAQTTARYS